MPVLGLRALLVGRQPHQPGEPGRRRTAVVDRRHRGTPPGARPRQRGGVVAAGKDALTVAARAQSGVQVDPAEPAALPTVILQHMAQRDVAPGRVDAAVEQPLGMGVLAAGDRGLCRLEPALGDVPLQRGLHVGARRPVLGHQQVRDLIVGGTRRQRLRKVLEVAVQVDALVGHAAQPRETVGVEGVHVQHRDVAFAHLRMPGRTLQQGHLHAGAAKALGAMAGAADDQQRGGVARALAHHVHRQRLAVAAEHRMSVAVDVEIGRLGGRDELAARLGVGLREGVGGTHDLRGDCASQASARRTHRVAPSGINSSLKS